MKRIMILVAICGYLGCSESEPGDGVSYTTQNEDSQMDDGQTENANSAASGQEPASGQDPASSNATPPNAENERSGDNDGQSASTDAEEQSSNDADEVESDVEQVSASDECQALCEYMEACGLCYFDANNECLELDACNEVCLAETPAPVASCIASLTACDDNAYQGCFDDNAGEDDCAEACRVLDACDECFVDDDGNCLSIAGCALICRESTPASAASCIASLTECTSIESCYE